MSQNLIKSNQNLPKKSLRYFGLEKQADLLRDLIRRTQFLTNLSIISETFQNLNIVRVCACVCVCVRFQGA